MATLWEVFGRSLRANEDRPALAFGEQTWTYGELAGAVADAVADLRARDVRPGDRVVLLLPNDVAFPTFDLAVMALGAVKVPLNAALTAREVAEIVERVRARVVVQGHSLGALAGQVDPGMVLTPRPAPRSGPAELPLPGAVGPDDPAVIYFTGGTTGRPKGVVHSQQSTVNNLMAHLLEGDIRRDERLLLSTPLTHAAGLFTLATLLRGAYARIEPGFDAERVLDLIDSDATTWMFAVPTMIYRMLDAAERRQWRPRTLATLQYGAAPIAADALRRALDRFGPVLQQLYAQTECPNYGSVLRKEAHVEALNDPGLLRSCGTPSLLCDITIRDEHGDVVGTGEVGEVCLRSDYLMAGYWDDPSAAADRFYGSWLRTGDVGYMDRRGFVYLVDRRHDMIVSGGMNVYSIEVEQALSTHPAVAAVAVIAVPHPDWGEAVHAVVVAGPGGADEEALRAHCAETLANYKRPKSYQFVTELPLTSYGKVDKKALRSGFWAATDRAIA